MKAYRRHFVRLNLMLVGAVLLVTLVLAGVYMTRSEYANMRQTMLETLEPFRGENGSFSYTPDAPDPPQLQEGAAARSGLSFSRCITVFFEAGEGNIVSGTADRDEETVLSAAAAAADRAEAFGYLKAYDLYYLAAGRADSAKVSLYPAGYLRLAVLKIAGYLLGAFALTLLACYGISRYLSKIAVRPVEQAMAYQIAKKIGAMSTVLCGRADAVLLTGGFAHDKMFTGWIEKAVGFIAPVFIYSGETQCLRRPRGRSAFSGEKKARWSIHKYTKKQEVF